MASTSSDDVAIAVTTLLLAAGELMENASAEAVSLLPADLEARCAMTSRLRSAGRDIAVLTAAAYTLTALPLQASPTSDDSLAG